MTLTQYIDIYCKDFDVYIEPVDGSVSIEITHKETGNWHNHSVCHGQELQGLMMLRVEWDLMCIRHEFNNEIH